MQLIKGDITLETKYMDSSYHAEWMDQGCDGKFISLKKKEALWA